ncbi:MAG TPA: hypothetical protein VF101_08620 [Gaiellaceae bacterium]
MTQFALPPIDAGQGPTFALAGRVVPMDGSKKVLDDHVVYVREDALGHLF